MNHIAAQPQLFDREQYRMHRPVQVISKYRQSPQYRRWAISPRHDRQKYEALVRQNFRCYECGVLLNPRYYDLHHARGYDTLGYEDAGDLVAVHRRCHVRLETRLRTEACGCARVA